MELQKLPTNIFSIFAKKMAVGSFFMVGALSKNVDHHDWPTKNALKHSPKKQNLDQNIKKLIFGILFLEILFWAYKVFIFIQTFQWISSEFFFNFRFSSRKSQSQQKLAKNITHFTIQFCSKNLTHSKKLNLLDIENNMLPQHSQKLF